MAKAKYLIVTNDGQGWVSEYYSSRKNAREHYKNNIPRGNSEARVYVYLVKTGELIAMAGEDIERHKIVNLEVGNYE